jgi:hypothetical protein
MQGQPIMVVVPNDIEFEFNKLFVRWQEETEYQSSSEMFENIYYHEIVRLGKNVIPHIINLFKIINYSVCENSNFEDGLTRRGKRAGLTTEKQTV